MQPARSLALACTLVAILAPLAGCLNGSPTPAPQNGSTPGSPPAPGSIESRANTTLPPPITEPNSSIELGACRLVETALEADRAAVQAKVPKPFVVRAGTGIGVTNADPVDETRTLLLVDVWDCTTATLAGAKAEETKFADVMALLDEPPADLSGGASVEHLFALELAVETPTLAKTLGEIGANPTTAKTSVTAPDATGVGTSSAAFTAGSETFSTQAAGETQGAVYGIGGEVRIFYHGTTWGYLRGTLDIGANRADGGAIAQAAGGIVGDTASSGRPAFALTSMSGKISLLAKTIPAPAG
ncbi:MAG: hypothetical protein ACYDCK_11920 [Thermoplasmatota archaeon]